MTWRAVAAEVAFTITAAALAAAFLWWLEPTGDEQWRIQNDGGQYSIKGLAK